MPVLAAGGFFFVVVVAGHQSPEQQAADQNGSCGFSTGHAAFFGDFEFGFATVVDPNSPFVMAPVTPFTARRYGQLTLEAHPLVVNRAQFTGVITTAACDRFLFCCEDGRSRNNEDDGLGQANDAHPKVFCLHDRKS